MESPNTITISRELYEALVSQDLWVQSLEAAGVDNWDGLEEAYTIFDELKADWDETQEENEGSQGENESTAG